MYHPDNGQRSYKPQTKRAERMIQPSSSQIYSRTYLWVTRSREQTTEKVEYRHLSSFFLLLSFFFFLIQLLTSIAYQLKQLLSCFTHRTALLSSYLHSWCCCNWKLQELRKALYDGCILGTYRILVNPTSGGLRPLGGIPTNLYLSESTVTGPSWRCGFLSWCVE